MRSSSPIIILALLLATGISCRTSYRAQNLQYKEYHIEAGQPKSDALQKMLKPYNDSVWSSMNGVIGTADVALEKKAAGGSLGNFMADAYFTMAKEKFGFPVDIAFMNYGGIRLTQLPAGPVTRGKIFELMPFDNVVVVQRMKGSQLKQLLDHIASRGGWPVAGMTMQMLDKKAVNVMIGGQPLDLNKTYITVNSDFVANGGDDAFMLKSIKQESIGYLMRDALFDYINKLKQQGRNIPADEKPRMVNAQ
ncbi:MAG TPA: 5'-nucleotidase [Chitinophagaceae bacterium]|nr:5'-nucleotidase [Chitinophagaceae bacterium]